ncbi:MULTISPECIES: multidrug effflux MFS transporter [Ensifer]|jgi:MFS transporter, DHA1 family, multidrug resistance protein|uniref:Bcr/CflA family efflux transporter n=1 Tax=Ensifer canadensis TaxID=555315 RepID=A0AAW4FQQ5_9HYPH|nr:MULTISPECIES: multidrug effflux MFS transporter [Ensifer]AHK42756.1 drug resistance transporter, Bcr/CflA subfamily [Ensifer adhaerens OV14]MDP9631962.1 DHA1 family bicyclomycin/chloramphenicol resistance-like MFS transporter [Ensifer adhaerens]KQU77459.1 multidrug transporter CflA [Ensifer sp. Root31]KQW34508.1 multidrug transporter CflA [Ensifer sp. Root1252]KQW56296.1 multidrug transporter CflA [Ensifer sp. Root127]
MTRRMSERRTSIIGAFLVALGPVSMALYTPAMPELVRAFSSSEAAIKMTLSLYFAGFAFAQLVSGTLSDVIGRRRTTLIFMTIYLAGSLMAAFAPSVAVLLAGRLVQGIGASVGMTVARAIVRDQFTGLQAARIMNMIGMMLAIGPAVSPTLGGLALGLFGWQSIFFLMVGFALMACVCVQFFMAETATPDPAKGHLRPILAAYRELLTDTRFVSSTLVIAGAVGALYAQATMLPFVLIGTVGLTPTEFGVGMLMQSGFFFSGTVTVRLLMRRFTPQALVPVGLCFIALGSVALAYTMHALEPSFLAVMAPVGVYAFGIAFVMPYMMTAAMAPFPHIAGTASAMMGFIQMGAGLLGGALAAVVGVPVLALGTIIPSFGLLCVFSYLWYRRTVRLTPLAAPVDGTQPLPEAAE